MYLWSLTKLNAWNKYTASNFNFPESWIISCCPSSKYHAVPFPESAIVQMNIIDDALFIAIKGMWSALCSNPFADSAIEYLFGKGG